MSQYRAWREDIEVFHRYQSTQPVKYRAYFDAPYWAAFVATPAKETLFVGLYEVELSERAIPAFHCPLTGSFNEAGTVDVYSTSFVADLEPYQGKLVIDWGAGTRSWAQYADRKLKPIIELRRSESDPPYPGHSALIIQLSQAEALPMSWTAILSEARGVYLLTCPRTKEQYVGAAFAGGGFLARWKQHASMSGDALAFRSRNPEDYRVSILEVAGSLSTDDDIVRMEQRWKEKLQSREMGLNRN
ncbi:GIY-YIG nuclease family protein [Sphingomonas sinipercae]|nr:GIY-YIG nuclease family protein [Sphingomonas sinipercae]